MISGGYEDDLDKLSEVTYTGQGGRDSRGRVIKDQELTLGNKALSINFEKKIPIRVVRGHQVFYGPKIGYRYDGLYLVRNYYQDTGINGFKIYRFYLESLLTTQELKKISGFS